jgi:hypothetical protein
MPYQPRTIAFLCELLHPPTVPDPAPVQRVHNHLFQSADPTYRSFTVTGEGAVLSNPPARPGAVSSATFLADRYQFREELSGLTVDEFARRVHEISAAVASATPGPEGGGVQIFTAQVVTIRTLVNPRRYQDSRSFVRDAMFGFGSELEDFRRPPQLYGMRLVFPPTPTEPHAFALRVESFANDPRSLFLENQGSFGPAVAARGLEVLAENVRTTYSFLVERALSFLAHFDVRQEA